MSPSLDGRMGIHMNFDELVALIKQNGIVGAGGAGFPTYAKLDKRADTIILNCAECEPLLKLHRQILERYAYEILSTLDLIAKTIGAKDVIIGVKGSYTGAVDAVEQYIGSFDHIRIQKLREIYPAGDEIVLIYQTTGRRPNPGALPISVGVTVFNVETIYNVYRALNGDPVTHKFVTVAGEVSGRTAKRFCCCTTSRIPSTQASRPRNCGRSSSRVWSRPAPMPSSPFCIRRAS